MTFLKSQRDEPNTLREYEIIYILRANASSDQVQEVNTRVRKVIEERQGKVLRLDNWGKRKLAYEIRKELKGIYLYWLFLGDAQLVHEVERNLRMLDNCIRYFSVAVDENVHPEVRPSEFDDETFAAAATIIPDEEDAYMGRTFGDDEHDDDDDDDERSVGGDFDDGDEPVSAAPRGRREEGEDPEAEAPAAGSHAKKEEE